MATTSETQSSSVDLDFLAKCEEELKDRFTERDEEFMKVANAESMPPPIVESWWVPQNSGRRNDRRFGRRNHPYERRNNYDNRESGARREHRGSNDSRDSRTRGYTDRGRQTAQRHYQPY